MPTSPRRTQRAAAGALCDTIRQCTAVDPPSSHSCLDELLSLSNNIIFSMHEEIEVLNGQLGALRSELAAAYSVSAAMSAEETETARRAVEESELREANLTRRAGAELERMQSSLEALQSAFAAERASGILLQRRSAKLLDGAVAVRDALPSLPGEENASHAMLNALAAGEPAPPPPETEAVLEQAAARAARCAEQARASDQLSAALTVETDAARESLVQLRAQRRGFEDAMRRADDECAALRLELAQSHGACALEGAKVWCLQWTLRRPLSARPRHPPSSFGRGVGSTLRGDATAFI